MFVICFGGFWECFCHFYWLLFRVSQSLLTSVCVFVAYILDKLHHCSFFDDEVQPSMFFLTLHDAVLHILDKHPQCSQNESKYNKVAGHFSSVPCFVLQMWMFKMFKTGHNFIGRLRQRSRSTILREVSGAEIGMYEWHTHTACHVISKATFNYSILSTGAGSRNQVLTSTSDCFIVFILLFVFVFFKSPTPKEVIIIIFLEWAYQSTVHLTRTACHVFDLTWQSVCKERNVVFSYCT